MDIATLILTLAIGSYLFGIALIVFQHGKDASKKIPFWIPAKFLQGTGSLLLYFREDLPPVMTTLVAGSLVLCGCAYEGWAVFHITGRTVSRRLHLAATAGIIAGCTVMLYLNRANGMAVNFFIHTLFYLLPGWALLRSTKQTSLLRRGLGWSFLLLALLFMYRALWALIVPEQSHLFFGGMIYQIMMPAVFCMMLISGFCMLLLSKEQIDQELQKALREHRVILENLTIGVCILRERIIEHCNPAMERIFGFSPGTLAGRHVRCFYENDEEYEEYGRRAYEQISRTNHFEAEVRFKRQNGERLWAWVEGTSIFSERPETHAVFSVTDITQQKMQQAMLVRQKEALEAADDSRNRFLKMASHEFRTPLGLLASSVDIIDRYWDRLSTEERRVQSSRIRSAAQQINGLISSVRSYDQPDKGLFDQPPQLACAANLCRSIAAEAETVWSRGHRFELGIADDCSGAMIDETIFRRIIQNLLSNAFSYTEPPGRVALRLERSGERLVLEVADSGIGIDEKDRERIFEEYFRGHNIGTRRGLGLGLPIVAEALERVNGTIRIESGIGMGTTMLVEIPVPATEG